MPDATMRGSCPKLRSRLELFQCKGPAGRRHQRMYEGTRGLSMDYATVFAGALEDIKREGRYRVFADIQRERGRFPAARHFTGGGTRLITVWCSNDYLCMGQNPVVLAAMHEAIDEAGAG